MKVRSDTVIHWGAEFSWQRVASVMLNVAHDPRIGPCLP